jgi:hypothetical protein
MLWFEKVIFGKNSGAVEEKMPTIVVLIITWIFFIVTMPDILNQVFDRYENFHVRVLAITLAIAFISVLFYLTVSAVLVYIPQTQPL